MKKKSIILYIILSVSIVTALYGLTKPKPIISVITSLYKGEEFIEEFLQDITRQTIFDKCELIIINANSPENEEPIIKKYMKHYPNIRYRKLDFDPGIYGVWNMAVHMAQGEFLTNANVDDRFSPNLYEKHLDMLLKHPEVDLVYSDFLETQKPHETFECNTATHRSRWPEYYPGLIRKCNPPHCFPMWRKSIHEKCGYFDAHYKNAGDWDMWLRAETAGSIFKKVDGIHCLYYRNPTGLSSDDTRMRQIYGEIVEIRNKYGIVKNTA